MFFNIKFIHTKILVEIEWSGRAEAVCNPYNAHRYYRVSNGGCVSQSSCSSSWDLYEASGPVGL